MYYYPDLIVSNLFYCTCTITADVSAPCACLSCSLAFLLLDVVFLSKYMMMMTFSHFEPMPLKERAWYRRIN